VSFAHSSAIISLPLSAFPPLAVGFFGLGTGYLIYGPQELFGFPRRDQAVDATSGIWGIWMPGSTAGSWVPLAAPGGGVRPADSGSGDLPHCATLPLAPGCGERSGAGSWSTLTDGAPARSSAPRAHPAALSSLALFGLAAVGPAPAHASTGVL
jgi:hypothetical protein